MSKLVTGIVLIGIVIGGVFLFSRLDLSQFKLGGTTPTPTPTPPVTSGANSAKCQDYKNRNSLSEHACGQVCGSGGNVSACRDCETVCAQKYAGTYGSSGGGGGGNTGGKTCDDYGGSCSSECNDSSIECAACNKACGDNEPFRGGGGTSSSGGRGEGGTPESRGRSTGGGVGGPSGPVPGFGAPSSAKQQQCAAFTGETKKACLASYARAYRVVNYTPITEVQSYYTNGGFKLNLV